MIYVISQQELCIKYIYVSIEIHFPIPKQGYNKNQIIETWFYA